MAETKATAKPAEEKKPAGICKYKVETDCYWNDILWYEDDEVDLDPSLNPPDVYFKKI